MSRFARLLGGCLVLVVAAALLQQPAGAAGQDNVVTSTSRYQAGADSPAPSLQVQSVPVLADGGLPFGVSLDVDTAGIAPENLEVGMRVGSRVSSRRAFRSADENPSRRSPQVRVPVTVTPDGRTTGQFSPVVAASGSHSAERLVLRGNGVYPLTFSLRSRTSGEVLDRIVTYAIRVDDTPQEPLALAWLWPVRSSPGAAPDDTEALEADLEPNGRLTVLLEQAAASTTPVTLVPSPETVRRSLDLVGEADTDDKTSQRGETAANSIADLTRSIAADRIGVVTPPYAHLEPTAMGSTGGLDDAELSRQLLSGSEMLELALGAGDASSPKVLVGPEVPSSTLLRLDAAGVGTVVVEDDAIEIPGSRQIPPTLARPFTFEDAPATTGVRADPFLDADLDESAGPVAAAQRLIADLTVLHTERPADRRGVVLLPELEWAPSRSLLEETTRRLDSIDHVEASTLQGLIDTVPVQTVGAGRSEETLEVSLSAVDATSTPEARSDRAAAGSLHNDLDQALALVCAAPGSCPEVQPVPEELEVVPDELTAATERLLTAVDEAIAGTPAFTAWTGEAEDTVRAVLDGISMPENVELTLTSREGTIPVSIQNAAPWPLYVRVTLRSGPLEFDDGRPEASRVMLVPPGNSTVDVPITAPSRGDYRIRAEVSSAADTGMVLARRTMTIHSTAVNEVAVALTVLSLLFLGLWWLIEVVLRRRRRGKHSGEAPQPAEGPPQAPPPVSATRRQPAAAATGTLERDTGSRPTSGTSS